MDYGQRIKELREERNLSLMALAKAIGVSDTAIYKWENRLAEPKLSNIARMSDFFNCTADYLMGRVDDFGWHSPIPLPAEDKRLLDAFHALPPTLKTLALETLQLWQRECKK